MLNFPLKACFGSNSLTLRLCSIFLEIVQEYFLSRWLSKIFPHFMKVVKRPMAFSDALLKYQGIAEKREVLWFEKDCAAASLCHYVSPHWSCWSLGIYNTMIKYSTYWKSRGQNSSGLLTSSIAPFGCSGREMLCEKLKVAVHFCPIVSNYVLICPSTFVRSCPQ